jgi:outer membrane murein-binding lipoprotein Lpp
MAMFMMGAMVVGAVGGTVAGGINSANQQQQIKNNVCQLAQQMKSYKSMMASETNLLASDAVEMQSKINDLSAQITATKDNIKMQHANFKITYNRWTIAGFVFMVVLIFVLASKKIILGASTEK